jgi:hypothetical protein
MNQREQKEGNEMQKNVAIQLKKNLEERISSLRKEVVAIYSNGANMTEASVEAQELEREIESLLRQHQAIKIALDKEDTVHGKAVVALKHGDEPVRFVSVTICNRCNEDSFGTDNFVVSRECLLAQTIEKTPINAIGEFNIRRNRTSVRVLSKDF